MTDDDIKHLAQLARIELSDEEVSTYKKEFTDILGYVEQIKEAVTDEPADAKAMAGDGFAIESAGVRNVFREDVDPHASGEYTDALLAAAPKEQKGYIEVQKILDTNDAT